jgi:hypothetical protein
MSRHGALKNARKECGEEIIHTQEPGKVPNAAAKVAKELNTSQVLENIILSELWPIIRKSPLVKSPPANTNACGPPACGERFDVVQKIG